MGETGCDIWGKGGVSANYLRQLITRLRHDEHLLAGEREGGGGREGGERGGGTLSERGGRGSGGMGEAGATEAGRTEV